MKNQKMIIGLVPLNDVPPTVKFVSDGMIVRFFRHNPKKLWFDRSKLLSWMNEGGMGSYSENNQFYLLSLKRTVVVYLVHAWFGHGTVRLKKDEFLAALKEA